ncbi:MAG: cation diffusion facilitator family transporter [Chloroflexota bacterium]
MFQSKTSVAMLSVASNTLLTLGKLGVGLTIGSIAVVAEAIHSSVDLLASVIALTAVRQSAKPPDEKYPFGRGKIENVSGTVEAVLIFLAAGMIIWEAANKLSHSSEIPQVDLGLVIMAISVGMNVLVSQLLFKVARETDSVALEADAYHLSTDVLTSLGVFIGLVLVRLTGWSVLDPVAALVVAALIIKAAWDITRRSFVDLLDRSLPAAERNLIANVINGHLDRLVEVHQIRTRKSGADRHIDLHLVVSATAPVAEAHALCDHLERDLRNEIGPCSLSIHIEPCRSDCSECQVNCRARTAGKAAS